MRSSLTWTQWLATGLVLTSLALAGAVAAPPVKLNATEKRVLTYLRTEWEKPGHLTTVRQALLALKVAPGQVSRVRIGQYLEQTRTYPRGFGLAKMPATALSATEKRLARLLFEADPAKARPLDAAAAAKALGVNSKTIQAALQTLLELKLVRRTGRRGAYRYGLTPIYRVGFPGINFLVHNASVDGGPPFNLT